MANMAIDIAAGVIVLLASIRGLRRGFLAQAIGLAALVGCVYAADPLRDLALPYAQAKFPTIQAPLFAKLLWWTAAVLGFVVMAGLATTIVKLLKTKPYNGEPEKDAADQGGGFVLGAAKGVIVTAFLLWGLQTYEPAAMKLGPWVEQQMTKSRVLMLSRKHHPAERLWHAPPVQSFVSRVKSRGFWQHSSDETAPPAESAPSTESPETESAPIQASAGRKPTLEMPKLDPDSPEFLREVDRIMKAAGLQDGSH
jgi:uncharacterized membrane protein required for colicin V production